MTTPTLEEPMSSLHIRQEITIEAPPAIVFDSILAELGPEGEMPDGKPFPMVIEPRPGGRWYRDLGNDAGHLWGHVQVIKPPTLLELWGPMFMSYPSINHVQYRLTPEGDGTRLTLTHRAMGHITPDVHEGVPEGWRHGLERVRAIARRLLHERRGTR